MVEVLIGRKAQPILFGSFYINDICVMQGLLSCKGHSDRLQTADE